MELLVVMFINCFLVYYILYILSSASWGVLFTVLWFEKWSQDFHTYLVLGFMSWLDLAHQLVVEVGSIRLIFLFKILVIQESCASFHAISNVVMEYIVAFITWNRSFPYLDNYIWRNQLFSFSLCNLRLSQ